MSETIQLLDDNSMQCFIRDGYVKLKVDFPKSFHDAIHRKTEEMFEKVGNPGNNLLPRIPELQRVWGHPAVHGALASILGKDYYLHPHRHCHENPPGSSDQQMHKDSLHNSRFAVDGNHRHHHTRWAMAFYYPQDTPIEMGPTAIWPRTQYFNAKPPLGEAEEVPLFGEAGTVVVVHYDVFHRKMRNTANKARYMIKFLFTRMSEPQSASWNHQRQDWKSSEDLQENLWQSMWNWHHGGNGNGQHTLLAESSIAELRKKLQDSSETVGLNVAYELGQIGSDALPVLIDALTDENEVVCRNAMYGFNMLGEKAVPVLIDALHHSSEEIRARAADTLGDIGLKAQDAIGDLIQTLADESKDVRSHVAEALGTIAQTSAVAVRPLIDRLTDDEELVRRNVSLSLARIGKHAAEVAPALGRALRDNSHFVRAFSGEALERIGTPEAMGILLSHLKTARWCKG